MVGLRFGAIVVIADGPDIGDGREAGVRGA